jgi:signal transduction histidine kinase
MQLGLTTGRRVGLWWIVLQSLGLTWGIQHHWSLRSAWLLGPPYLGFQVLAFLVLEVVARETRGRLELARANAELVSTRELLAESARLNERLRIARELHDVVAHSVSVMTVQAGAERRVLKEDDSSREVLLAIEQTGRQAMAEMRRMLGMLRVGHEDLALAPQPGMEHVDVLVQHVRAAGLPVEWRVEGDPVALTPGVDLAAYRIIQEGLTNILKHAGPASAAVTVRYATDDLDIEIVDDGCGAPDVGRGGHGLIGMAERVALYGGRLDTGTRSPHGYVVHARLPLGRP